MVGLLFLPLLEAAGGWLRVLVGLLFEICIVDASIFATRRRRRLSVVVLVVYVCAGMPLIGVCWSCFFVSCFEWCRRQCAFAPFLFLCVCGGGVCCFDVVETSYEGHMVDALASRADEGRWSLR